jgi:endoglucanase
METAGLLKELTEARGPSGYEREVRQIVRKRFEAFADETRVDAIGNLIALRRGEPDGGGRAAGKETPAAGGPTPSIMLAGHMDEIALMVLQIEKGFLRMAQVGGFDPRVLLGQPLTVHGKRELPGFVVSVPPHFTEPGERDKPVPLEKLFVDVGLPRSEVEALVRVGDLATLASRYTELAGGYAYCKSMDDRAAVATIALCLEELSRRRHSWDVYAVATAQEEATMAGAAVGAYGIAPTIAIAIDVTFGQQPGVSGPETVKMDGGPAIATGPNIHPGIFTRLMSTAKSLEIPHQVDVVPGASGTDAWAIQVSRSGVPCGLVSIPLRSIHTPVETVCLRDIERIAKLLAEFICRLDASFADSLAVRDALAAPPAPAASAAPAGDPAPAADPASPSTERN